MELILSDTATKQPACGFATSTAALNALLKLIGLAAKFWLPLDFRKVDVSVG